MTEAPRRVQLSRAKGWRMPENTVKVDRRTQWGNPFDLRHSDHCWTALAWGFKGDRAGRQGASVAMFRDWLTMGRAHRYEGCGLYAVDEGGEQTPLSVGPTIGAPAPPSIDNLRAELRGKNLACWCALDAPCHADVLIEIANIAPADLHEHEDA